MDIVLSAIFSDFYKDLQPEKQRFYDILGPIIFHAKIGHFDVLIVFSN